MTAQAFDEQWVELADRMNDGLDVRLYWNRGDGRVKVTVTRMHTGRVAELRVAPGDAMTAFHHPFSYKAPASAPARSRRLHA